MTASKIPAIALLTIASAFGFVKLPAAALQGAASRLFRMFSRAMVRV
jgi:hypothetical protein